VLPTPMMSTARERRLLILYLFLPDGILTYCTRNGGMGQQNSLIRQPRAVSSEQYAVSTEQ
jgi:hypothetical protein